MVRELVAGQAPRELKFSAGENQVVPHVIDDVVHYRLQVALLQGAHLAPAVAAFKDKDTGETLPVLLRVPSLSRVEATYDFLRGLLANSKIPVANVTPETADKIFVDRLAEFIAVGTSSGAAVSAVVADTIVESNRAGDIILYAKGYFTSTGTAFGKSKRARRQLIPAGRYSFGIIDGGVAKFDNIVWDCPTTVSLPLP
jgi:hypothetical protein